MPNSNVASSHILPRVTTLWQTTSCFTTHEHPQWSTCSQSEQRRLRGPCLVQDYIHFQNNLIIDRTVCIVHQILCPEYHNLHVSLVIAFAWCSIRFSQNLQIIDHGCTSIRLRTMQSLACQLQLGAVAPTAYAPLLGAGAAPIRKIESTHGTTSHRSDVHLLIRLRHVDLPRVESRSSGSGPLGQYNTMSGCPRAANRSHQI